MIDLNPIPDPENRPDTLDDDISTFMPKLPQFAADLIALQANVVANASGGAFSLGYSVDTASTAAGDPGDGKIRFNNASVAAATQLYIDLKTAGGATVGTTLAQLGASTSAVKSTLRIAQSNDAAKFVVYQVTAYSAQSGYGVATVQHVESSSTTPFSNGSLVGLFMDRTGDKGEKGDTGAGAHVLLGAATVSSAVANIDFLNIFSSAYDKYVIEVQNITPSAASVLALRLAKLGAVDSTAAYSTASGDSGSVAPADQTQCNLTTTFTHSGTFTIEVSSVNNAIRAKSIFVRGTWNSGSGYGTNMRGGVYAAANAATGFRLFFAAGSNFTEGTVRVYGIKNT